MTRMERVTTLMTEFWSQSDIEHYGKTMIAAKHNRLNELASHLTMWVAECKHYLLKDRYSHLNLPGAQ